MEQLKEISLLGYGITADIRVTKGFKKVCANKHSELSSCSFRLRKRERRNNRPNIVLIYETKTKAKTKIY